jgi:hypothetical protein
VIGFSAQHYIIDIMKWSVVHYNGVQAKKSNWPPFLTIYDVTLPGGTGFFF